MTALIRMATPLDREGIRHVHLQAFPDGENRRIAALAVSLLGEATTPETFSLVAEIRGRVAGHVAFSPVTDDTAEDWVGYILAPLGVVPERHGSGIGSQLVKAGIERISGGRFGAVFVYGDPKYYGRFGFSAESAAGFAPPYALQYPFGWQAILLHGGTGPNRPARLSCVDSLRAPDLW